MDEYIGIVKLFAGTFAPQNWAFCNGQLMSIAQNSALFAILGTTYGGDGVTTFALPNLQSRVPVGMGQGPGLPRITQGEVAGSAQVTLTQQQMPAHTHLQQFANVPSTTNAPAGNVVSQITAADAEGIALTASGFAPATSALVAGAPQGISPAGGNQPVSIMQPYLGMNYIICLNGLFPPRS